MQGGEGAGGGCSGRGTRTRVEGGGASVGSGGGAEPAWEGEKGVALGGARDGSLAPLGGSACAALSRALTGCGFLLDRLSCEAGRFWVPGTGVDPWGRAGAEKGPPN